MKVLLTGSTGLLGSHLLEQGLAAGHEFKLPIRNLSKRSYLASISDHDNIETFDISESWSDEIFKDCDLIIHCAGFASPFEKDHKTMEEVNVELTKKIYGNKGGARFVHISSIATYCSGKEDYVVSEENPGQVRDTYYAKTKSLADLWLDEQNDDSLLIFHPCYMFGKYDSRPSSGSIFLALKMGRIDHYINRVKNFVAASDVASGIWQAISKENISGHYILGGENIELSYFFKQAIISLQMDRELHESDHSDNSLIQEFCTSGPVDYSKAMNDFAYNPLMNLQEMIGETVDYFIEKKMLRIKPKRSKIKENS